MQSDVAGHHRKLLDMAKRRCRAEKTLRRAALLAGHNLSSLASFGEPGHERRPRGQNTQRKPMRTPS
jgi:hypothetical protein